MSDTQPSTTVPDLRAVTRIISTIQTTRSVLLACIAVGTGIGVFAGEGGFFSVMALLYGVIAALTTYVVLGWFEHTLGLLSGIYRNTLR